MKVEDAQELICPFLGSSADGPFNCRAEWCMGWNNSGTIQVQEGGYGKKIKDKHIGYCKLIDKENDEK